MGWEWYANVLIVILAAVCSIAWIVAFYIAFTALLDVHRAIKEHEREVFDRRKGLH